MIVTKETIAAKDFRINNTSFLMNNELTCNFITAIDN